MDMKDWARLIALSVLWGGSFLFVEIALEALPPLSVVWARVTLGAVLVALMLRLGGVALPRGAAVWRALAVMGLLTTRCPSACSPSRRARSAAVWRRS